MEVLFIAVVASLPTWLLPYLHLSMFCNCILLTSQKYLEVKDLAKLMKKFGLRKTFFRRKCTSASFKADRISLFLKCYYPFSDPAVWTHTQVPQSAKIDGNPELNLQCSKEFKLIFFKKSSLVSIHASLPYWYM